MGFFYQAIRRATGYETEPVPQTRPGTEAEAQTAATPDVAIAATAVAEAPLALPPIEVKASPVPKLDPARVQAGLRGKLRSFDVRHPLKHLVAFLTPPVLTPNLLAMEQCRVLRARLRDIAGKRKLRSIMLTSAMPGEGKTLLAVNLAFAMSQLEDTKVLLVDADMRRPSVAKFLGMQANEGLDRYLRSNCSLDEVTWSLTPSLDVVPTGDLQDEASDLLHGSRMRNFLAEAGERYTYMIFDGPPLFPIVDAQVLGHIVDGALLVVRAHSTPFDLARQACDVLKTKLVGTVLNCADAKKHSGYYTYYGSKASAKRALSEAAK